MALLMCDPYNFGVSYEINPWMAQQIGAVDVPLAREQWLALHQVLSSLTEVVVMPSVPGWPDLVFTANAGLALPDSQQIILATFRHPERQGELAFNQAWFEGQGWATETLESVAFEGAGDALFDAGGRLWVAEGPRSDKGVLQRLRTRVGVPTVGLTLADPRFYHLDTCFCPLSRGFAMAVASAFDLPSRDYLDYAFQEKLIALTPDEAALFCANAVCVDETVVMNVCPPRLKALLAERGFSVVETPLTEFLKSGGSAKCLTLALD